MIIKFKDAQHKEFFLRMQEALEVWDVNHRALFYCLGISNDCRRHIDDLVAWDKEARIKYDTAFSNGWLTSGSTRCVRLAYNLFNGFSDEFTTPEDLFADSDAAYYLEAVKVRYPEFLDRKDAYQVIDEKGCVLRDNVCSLVVAESYAKACEEEYGGTYTIKVQEPITLDV